MQKQYVYLRPGIKLALRFVISLFKLKSRMNGQVKQALRPGAEYRFFMSPRGYNRPVRVKGPVAVGFV